MTAPTGVVLQQKFEEQNREIMLKKSHANSIKIGIRNVIPLDSQSTMDLFCNSKFVENIYNYKKKMRLHNNGGKMLTTRNTRVASYNPLF